MSNNLFIIFNNKMSQKSVIKQKAGNLEITNRPSSSSKKGGKSGGGGENAKNNKSVTIRGPNVRGGSTSSSSPKTAKITKGGRPSSSGGRKIASNTTKGGFGPYEETKKRSMENKVRLDKLESWCNADLMNEINVLKEDRDYCKAHVMWMRRFLTNLMIRSSNTGEDLKKQLKTIDLSEGKGITLWVIESVTNEASPLLIDNIDDDYLKYFKRNVYELNIQHNKPTQLKQ